jgi:predicted glutamine amidotransferase
VGHVRWASNPLKLPRRELIGIAHTQPFVHDRWLFAHNGTLYIPQEVTTALGPWAAWVKGKNDSEVLFYWLMKTFLRRTGMPALRSVGSPDLLRRSLQDLDRIGARCKSRYPLHPYPYHGLNWILTNGRRLYAFCYVNPRGFDKAKALSRRSQPYFQLQVKRTASTLVVASEPLDFDADWRPMRHGELLIAQRTAGRIRSHRFQVL